MKRFLSLLVLMVAATAALAQEPAQEAVQENVQERPIIPERETIVVDNFTAVPNITLGLFQYARQCVMEGLAHRRLNVIDVEQDGYGRADIVYPSLRYAHANAGNPYDINRVVRIMNDYKEARYYLTCYISRFNSHPVEHHSKDSEGKEVVKTDFSCVLEADVYLFDAETQMTIGPLRWRYDYNGASNPEFAERQAIENFRSKARSFVTDEFRFKASVIQLGEYNKRGKLQDLYLSCGSDMDVSNGDVFFLYVVSDINGIESARKIGKVKVREITGRESCRCSVSNGEAEIDQAFKNGERIVAISDYDRYF